MKYIFFSCSLLFFSFSAGATHHEINPDPEKYNIPAPIQNKINFLTGLIPITLKVDYDPVQTENIAMENKQQLLNLIEEEKKPYEYKKLLKILEKIQSSVFPKTTNAKIKRAVIKRKFSKFLKNKEENNNLNLKNLDPSEEEDYKYIN